jgi:6-phosphofructokinase
MPFELDRLGELLTEDRNANPSNYAVVVVSEGAMVAGEHIIEKGEADAYGHKKLGGIGDKVSAMLKEISPKFNNGRRVNVVNQRLGYLVRSGAPDSLDSIVPMAFGNLALDLVLQKTSGRLVSLRNGIYDSVPIEVVTGRKKVVDVQKFYDTDRLRPKYESFIRQPLLVMTGDS